MIYGFNSEDVAQELKRIGLSSIGGEGTDPDPTGLEVIFVKTPAAGIAGKDGSGVMSEGECTLAHIDGDEFSDDSDTVDIINTGTDALSGDTYIAAVKSGVNWVPIVGSGGGGGGRTVYQLQATTGVSAASGLTTGSGTAEVLELQMPSGVYQGFGTFETVRNPWEETIATGSMLTCHLENGVYVIIQASCPSE